MASGSRVLAYTDTQVVKNQLQVQTNWKNSDCRSYLH